MNCGICEKALSGEDFKKGIPVSSNYYICSECSKYVTTGNSSIPATERFWKLKYAYEKANDKPALQRFIDDRIETIKKSMSDDELAVVSVLSKQIRQDAMKDVLEKEREEKEKKSNVAAESFDERVTRGIVLVTTDFVTGHSIKKMLGPVSGCIAVGAGVIKSYMASISATFGTKSESFSKKMAKTIAEAETAMLEEAKDMGANAVIDVHYAISNFAADMTGVLVTGTAVVIA